jgi:hypothetical protein
MDFLLSVGNYVTFEVKFLVLDLLCLVGEYILGILRNIGHKQCIR